MTAKKYRVVLTEEQARMVVRECGEWVPTYPIVTQLREQLEGVAQKAAVKVAQKAVVKESTFEDYCREQAARTANYNNYYQRVYEEAHRRRVSMNRLADEGVVIAQDVWHASRGIRIVGVDRAHRLYLGNGAAEGRDVTIDLRGIYWENPDGQFAPDIHAVEGAYYKGFNWHGGRGENQGIGPVLWVMWTPNVTPTWRSSARGSYGGSTWENVNAWCKPGCQDLEPFGRTIQRLQRIVARERTDLQMRDLGTWDVFDTPHWQSRAEMWLEVMEPDYRRGGPPSDSSDSLVLGGMETVGQARER